MSNPKYCKYCYSRLEDAGQSGYYCPNAGCKGDYYGGKEKELKEKWAKRVKPN